MNTSNVSSRGVLQQVSQPEGFRQRPQGFRKLSHALESGDAASAKDAFGALLKKLQDAQANGQKVPLLDSNTQAGKDFQALQKAVESGDLHAAKSAFAAVRQDIRGAGQGHQHGHHVESSADTPPGATNPGAATDSTASQTTMSFSLEMTFVSFRLDAIA